MASGEATASPGDVLAQAVAVLYGAHDSEQRNRANEWLNRFSQGREAWQASLDLVGVNNGHSVEVQFFAANLLHSKVRKDILSLNGDERKGVIQLVRSKLQSILSLEYAIVKERVAFALTVGCVLCTCPELVLEFATGLLALENSVCDKLALLMLSLLAEEAENLDRNRRQVFVQLLLTKAESLFKFIDQLIETKPQRMLSVSESVSKCITAWIKLNPPVSLGSAASNYGNLFNFLLNGVVSHCSSLNESQWSVSCAETLGALIEKCPPSDIPLYPQLIQFLLQSENSSKLIASESGIEAVAKIATAIAANYGNFFQMQEGLVLSQFFLQALNQVETRSVKENILEFFLDLNTIPMQERLPQLRIPLYESLMVKLITDVASYPADFISWEDCLNDDKESFHRFREQFLNDLFETAFTVLGMNYFKCITSLFSTFADKASNSGWQTAEAAIFALRIVAVQVKSRLNPRSAVAEAREIHQMLKMIFLHVTDGAKQDIFLSHHILVESISRLIGSYAQWFAKHAESPIEQCLSYLIRALQLNHPVGESNLSMHAAHSFKNMCMRCSYRLQSKEIVMGLINATSECINGAGRVDLPDKKALVEGVSRLISQMTPEDASFAVQQLLHPILHHLQSVFVSSCNGNGEFSVYADLEIYASAIRFFEFSNLSNPSSHPTLQILRGSWEIFEAVLGKSEVLKSEDNVKAFCSIFGTAIQSAKSAILEVLPAMLGNVLKILQFSNHSDCLQVISDAVEVFGSNDSLKQHLSDIVHQSFSLSFAFLQAVKIAEYAEHVQAVYSLAGICLIFVPEIVLMPNILATLVQTGTSTIILKERESVRAVNSFFLQLFSLSCQRKTSTWVAAQPAVMECMNVSGKNLLANMLIAFGETCPAHLFRSLGACIYHLKTFSGQTFDQWFIEILRSEHFKQYLFKCNPAIKEEDIHFFIHAVLKQPSMPKPKFEALFSDFAKVCRCEQASDCLHMYE